MIQNLRCHSLGAPAWSTILSLLFLTHYSLNGNNAFICLFIEHLLYAGCCVGTGEIVENKINSHLHGAFIQVQKDRQKPHTGACHKLEAQKGMTTIVDFLVYPRLSAFSNLKYWRASMSPWSYSSLSSVQLLSCVQLFATP